MTTVELRCDRFPSKMFAKIQRPTIVDGNLIEVACVACRKDRGVRQVLHRFDVLGQLIETEEIDDLSM